MSPPLTIKTNWSRRDTAHHATSSASACDLPDCRGAKIAVTNVSNRIAATCTAVIGQE